MGSWHLEVFRMAVYMSFPIGAFYLFNNPQFFESYLEEMRRPFKESKKFLHTKEEEETLKEAFRKSNALGREKRERLSAS